MRTRNGNEDNIVLSIIKHPREDPWQPWERPGMVRWLF
jgi:hypothetical protein